MATEPHPLHRGQARNAPVHRETTRLDIGENGLSPTDAKKPELLADPLAQLGSGREAESFRDAAVLAAFLENP